MKFVLIAAALNLQMVYPSEEVCNKALEQAIKNDPAAICIPAGEDSTDRVFSEFLDLVKQLQTMQSSEGFDG